MSFFTTMFWTAPPSNNFWGSPTTLPFWLSSGWTQAAIGSGVTGSFASSAGTYTVAGSGYGVSGASDNLYFVNQQIVGNMEVFAKVTNQNGTDPFAIAGLMLSDSPTPSPSNQCALVSVSPQNGVNFTYRTADGQSASTVLGPSLTAPIWLRLVVSQSSVAGFSSNDGISWQLIGQTAMTIPAALYVGFAVASNISGVQNTATYTNLNFLINVPQRLTSIFSTWTQAPIGSASGSFTLNADGSYTVSGNGTGVNPSYANDALFFAGQQTAGLAQMTAEVTTLSNSNTGAFGGIMISDLSTSHPTTPQCAVAGITVANGLQFQARPTDNAPLNPPVAPVGSPPRWFQLQVLQGQVQAFSSTDGLLWTPLASPTMTLPSTFYMGFAVWSQQFTADPDTTNSVTFKNVSAMQSAEMLIWLRPDNAIIYSGSNISSWNDQSARGFNAAQSNSSNQPALATNAVNGLAAASFNGTSNFLKFPTIPSAFALGLTLFVLINETSITAGEQIISLGTANGNQYSLGLRFNAASQPEYFVYDSTGSVLTTVAYPGTMPTGTQLISVVHSGNSATLYLNGQASLTNNAMNNIPTPSSGRTNSYLGQASAGGSYFNGDIVEVLLYQRSMAPVERQNIEAYFINKYAFAP